MSKTPKHTRGPWKILPENPDGAYIRIRGTRLGERYRIADVGAPDLLGKIPEREAQETRANARLILASPDMLETIILGIGAIKELCAIWGIAPPQTTLRRMQGAVDKATGEQE